MAKVKLKVPTKRSEGPGCKVYFLGDKKIVRGQDAEVTVKESEYLLETGLFEEVEEVKEEKKTAAANKKEDK